MGMISQMWESQLQGNMERNDLLQSDILVSNSLNSKTCLAIESTPVPAFAETLGLQTLSSRVRFRSQRASPQCPLSGRKTGASTTCAEQFRD